MKYNLCAVAKVDGVMGFTTDAGPLCSSEARVCDFHLSSHALLSQGPSLPSQQPRYS
jgi:hypothetical protein